MKFTYTGTEFIERLSAQVLDEKQSIEYLETRIKEIGGDCAPITNSMQMSIMYCRDRIRKYEECIKHTNKYSSYELTIEDMEKFHFV